MKPQYITNEKGKKIAVVIPVEQYAQMIERLEEFADIRAYDDAKMVNEPSIPIKRAFKELDAKRK
jgi:PHD/YefM family antitoxin component YafN of YafNO toxin-antitoxin module